jgi:hypothetical protein
MTSSASRLVTTLREAGDAHLLVMRRRDAPSCPFAAALPHTRANSSGLLRVGCAADASVERAGQPEVFLACPPGARPSLRVPDDGLVLRAWMMLIESS